MSFILTEDQSEYEDQHMRSEHFKADCTTFKISHPICSIKYTNKKRVRVFMKISL